ncbi:hypothetical protein VTO73DRAFT_7073 [Trametes versicolor]
MIRIESRHHRQDTNAHWARRQSAIGQHRPQCTILTNGRIARAFKVLQASDTMTLQQKYIGAIVKARLCELCTI